jgi:hypothetical protein
MAHARPCFARLGIYLCRSKDGKLGDRRRPARAPWRYTMDPDERDVSDVSDAVVDQDDLEEDDNVEDIESDRDD